MCKKTKQKTNNKKNNNYKVCWQRSSFKAVLDCGKLECFDSFTCSTGDCFRLYRIKVPNIPPGSGEHNLPVMTLPAVKLLSFLMCFHCISFLVERTLARCLHRLHLIYGQKPAERGTWLFCPPVLLTQSESSGVCVIVEVLDAHSPAAHSHCVYFVHQTDLLLVQCVQLYEWVYISCIQAHNKGSRVKVRAWNETENIKIVMWKSQCWAKGETP